MSREKIIREFAKLGIKVEWEMFGQEGGYLYEGQFIGDNDKVMEELLESDKKRLTGSIYNAYM